MPRKTLKEQRQKQSGNRIEPILSKINSTMDQEEQMEMIYKDQKNGTTTFKDHCDKVREDNPK